MVAKRLQEAANSFQCTRTVPLFGFNDKIWTIAHNYRSGTLQYRELVPLNINLYQTHWAKRITVESPARYRVFVTPELGKSVPRLNSGAAILPLLLRDAQNRLACFLRECYLLNSDPRAERLFKESSVRWLGLERYDANRPAGEVPRIDPIVRADIYGPLFAGAKARDKTKFWLPVGP